jgi:hypothetical protein
MIRGIARFVAESLIVDRLQPVHIEKSDSARRVSASGQHSDGEIAVEVTFCSASSQTDLDRGPPEELVPARRAARAQRG